jgi:hypothetical protein
MDISTPKQNILNRQFQSVFTDNITVTADDFKKGNYINPQSTHPVAPEISITTWGISKLLLALNTHKAARPDTTSPSILKDLAIDIAPILTTMYTLSQETSTIPNDWKKANVSPVCKKQTFTPRQMPNPHHLPEEMPHLPQLHS